MKKKKEKKKVYFAFIDVHEKSLLPLLLEFKEVHFTEEFIPLYHGKDEEKELSMKKKGAPEKAVLVGCDHPTHQSFLKFSCINSQYSLTLLHKKNTYQQHLPFRYPYPQPKSRSSVYASP